MICECGGLITEQGKSYCYMGKICRCYEPKQRKAGTQADGSLSNRTKAALELLNTLKDMLEKDQILEIIKEPCKHEPELKIRGLKEMLELPFNAPLEFTCRKCLQPIKAEKWVEA